MSNIQPLPFRRPTVLDYVETVDDPFDFIVVGGGATGVYVALDAASRGYRTILLERGDFASSTSSRSTKLIHGGVRYMQQGRIRLVRESLRERGYLLNNAPHLVRALPIVVPAYSRWQRLKYTAGVMGYDALSRGHRMGGTRRLGASKVVEAVPGIRKANLRGGAVYLDGQTDDARLALAIAKTAASHGAALLNYADVKSLRTENGRVTGIEAEDLLTGDMIRVTGRAVINATGTYTDQTLKLDSEGGPGLMRWSRGTHLVVDGSILERGHGILVPETSDGRVIYALPWLGATLVGTTDVPVESPDADLTPPAEDVEFLLKEISTYLPETAEMKVISAFTGIRPLVSNSASSSTSKLARSHQIFVSKSGLVTVTGGKWTTARLMAEQAVDRALEVAGLPTAGSATESLRLEGFSRAAGELPGSLLDDPDSLYGENSSAIVELEQRSPELAAPLAQALPYRLSHAVYAVNEEMAQTLEDVLARRTRSLFLNAEASVAAASGVAETIERHCGVEAGWAQNELAKVPDVASGFLASGSTT